MVQLIMPELYTLLEWDREKGSNLFATLEACVQMKSNGRATAKQLFIHRTTFLYLGCQRIYCETNDAEV